MLTRRARATSVAVAGVSTLALLGGRIAIASDLGQSSAPAPSLSPPRTAAVTAVSPEITANFAIFRNRSASPLPPNVAVQVGSPERYGRNPDLAREVQTATGKRWIIPGDGYICLAVPDPVEGYGTSCSAIETVRRQGLSVGMFGGKGIPDGKSAETLLRPDGTSSKLADANTAVADPNDDGVVSEYVPVGETITAVK